MKMMNTNTEHLLNLIKENPELPIVPLVDYEVVSEDYGIWLGSFGRSEVGEYARYNDRYFDDREEFKEYYYNLNDEYLCEKYSYDPRINEYSVQRMEHTIGELRVNELNEQFLEQALDEIADEYFVKAILVNIDLPD